MNVEMKCVIMIDEELPLGLIANTAAILGMSFGNMAPDLIGCDVEDKDKVIHKGIISTPLPILKGHDRWETVFQKLKDPAFADVQVIDFTRTAQCCKHYEEYIEHMSQCSQHDLTYMGIVLYGTKKQINALTGSLPLLR